MDGLRHWAWSHYGATTPYKKTPAVLRKNLTKPKSRLAAEAMNEMHQSWLGASGLQELLSLTRQIPITTKAKSQDL
jgi:hypothetical protein